MVTTTEDLEQIFSNIQLAAEDVSTAAKEALKSLSKKDLSKKKELLNKASKELEVAIAELKLI